MPVQDFDPYDPMSGGSANDALGNRLGRAMVAIVNDPDGTGGSDPSLSGLIKILRPARPTDDSDVPGLLGSRNQLIAMANRAPDPSAPSPPAGSANTSGTSGASGDGLGQIRADPAPSQWDSTKGLLDLIPPGARPMADRPGIDALNKALAPPVFGATGPQYPNSLDPVVGQAAAEYNQRHGFKLGDAKYLDPDLPKAIIRQESGFNQRAYQADPMQVNGPDGDWDPRKASLGLTKGVAPGADLGVKAGIGWLLYKSYLHDASGRPTTFLGWPKGVAAYNQRNAKGDAYSRSVMRHLDNLKKGG
jgi:hypothetical protein